MLSVMWSVPDVRRVRPHPYDITSHRICSHIVHCCHIGGVLVYKSLTIMGFDKIVRTNFRFDSAIFAHSVKNIELCV